jgi:hypothetical protein
MGIRAIGGRGILRWHWGNTRRTAAAVVAAGLSVLVVGISAGATSSQVVWTTKQAFPGEGVGHIYDVSCPTSTACMAVATYAGGPDVVLTSTDGGQSWRENAIGNTTPTLTGISCPTTSACVAVGDTAIELSQDGGSTWSNVPAPAFVISWPCRALLRLIASPWAQEGSGRTTESLPRPTEVLSGSPSHFQHRRLTPFQEYLVPTRTTALQLA